MAGKVMKAIQYSRYGGGASALKHVEVVVPAPKANEVLLKVEAASLNAFDWKIQKGVTRPVLPRKFPYIPGTDVAGEVVQTGSDVNKFKVGDKVLAIFSHATGGALAEYAVAKENLTVVRPPEVSASEGAGLPLAALTAHMALTRANINLDGGGERKNILITAASSGVGHYAVQLAKLANTHITATCGARNLDLVKSLGADEVLDYKTVEGASLKGPLGKKYDCVIHCAMGIPWATFKPNLSDNAVARAQLGDTMDAQLKATEIYRARIRAEMAAGKIKTPGPPSDPTGGRKRKRTEGEDPLEKEVIDAEHINDAFGDNEEVVLPFSQQESTPKFTEEEKAKGVVEEMPHDASPVPTSPKESSRGHSIGTGPNYQQGENPDTTIFELDSKQKTLRINRAMKHLASSKDIEVISSYGLEQVDGLHEAWLETSVRLETLSRSYVKSFNEYKAALEKADKKIKDLKEAAKTKAKATEKEMKKLTKEKDTAVDNAGNLQKTIEVKDRELADLKLARDQAEGKVTQLEDQFNKSVRDSAMAWLESEEGQTFKYTIGESASQSVADDMKETFMKVIEDVAPQLRGKVLKKFEDLHEEKMAQIRREIEREMEAEMLKADAEAKAEAERAAVGGNAGGRGSRQTPVHEVQAHKSQSTSASVAKEGNAPPSSHASKTNEDVAVNSDDDDEGEGSSQSNDEGDNPKI